MADDHPAAGALFKHEVHVDRSDAKEAATARATAAAAAAAAEADAAPAPKRPPLARLFGKSKDAKGPAAEDAAAAEKPPSVPFSKLFRFTTPVEKAMMAFGCICAAVHGAMLPLFTIVFGSVLDTFASRNTDKAKLVRDIGGLAKWFVILAVVAFIVSFFQVRLQMVVAQRASTRIRTTYFRSLMRQDFEWYDGESSGELTTRVSSDVDLIQAGMGDKVGSAIQFVSSFVAGFIIAFAYSWLLTLVILAMTPLLAVCGVIFAKSATESVGEGQSAYGAAGSVASEVLSLIRTVTAFGGQEEEARRYEKQLDSAYKSGVKKSMATGLGYGVMFFIIFCIYGISFWFAAKLIREGRISITDLFVAFFSVIIGAMGLGQAAPSFSAFAAARGAAPRVYQVIDRQSSIDPLSDEGEVMSAVQGNIAFEGVTFNYKSRANEGGEPVLKNLNLSIAAGSTHALVGPSGCGKSSTMGLIERFYDANEGRVTLDGVPIRDLNVRWLRAQMGYVGQMPTLFRASIRDNIAYGAATEVLANEGKDGRAKGFGDLKRHEVTEEEIIAAAKLANAHSFIMKLPEKYDTLLGERGALLSGGQKQRICIARAIVRNPKILLLDEATSALDSQSERIVQEALERAAEGRTTILIAHRLSTVRNADCISVFKDGVIVESGRHDELMQRSDGAYRHLVELQEVHAAKQSTETRGKDVSNVGDDGIVKWSAVKIDSFTKSGAESTEQPGERVGDEDGDDLPVVDKGVFSRAFKLNTAELPFIFLGMLGAGLSGAAWPISAYVFSNVTSILAEKNNGSKVRFWALMYVVIGGASLVGGFLQLGMLGISGEMLTRKLRARSFRALLRQEMGYFDLKENSVGALSTRLAREATLVKGVTGDTLGAATVAISTVLVGLGVSFSGCWRLALVVLAMFPFMALGSYFQMKMMSGFDSGAKKDFSSSGAIASEAVDNIRTVAGVGIQDIWIERYGESLVGPLKKGRKGALVTGIAFGFSEFSMFGLWAVAFWVGAKFIEKDQCTFLGLMKAVTGLLFAGFSLGNVSMFMPDLAAANVAATNIFRLLDRESKIDPLRPGGKLLSNVRGHVGVHDAEFEYPSRSDVAVLRGLSLSVAPGKTLALVGQSGCGKSTVVALLERFYDVRSGSVKIEHEELRDLDVENARSHMAFVQQEPDLFNRSIKENILYGIAHTDGTPITDEQVVEAAKAANAHEFISSFPQGYDTPVGERGSALSGGQRQRVAIARSLIRQPRVLLLDEATSALDARSERVVQDALDEARMGRTTIVIAHRLSTVKDADAIALISRGKVAEIGTHAELMAKGGKYAELVENQLTEEN